MYIWVLACSRSPLAIISKMVHLVNLNDVGNVSYVTTADQNKLSLYKLIQIRDLVFKNFPVAKPGAVKCKNK